MICYVKTIHSHTIAEIFKRKVIDTSSIKAGSICQLNNGYLTNKRESDCPNYLVIEDKIPTDGKTYVDCIRLVPGMILKGTYDFNPTDVKIGQLCSFCPEFDEQIDTITTGGEDAELLDINGNIATILINK